MTWLTIICTLSALIIGFVLGYLKGLHPKADGMLVMNLYDDPPMTLRLIVDVYEIIKRKGLYIKVDSSSMAHFKDPTESEEQSK